jgi:hypothetical protein
MLMSNAVVIAQSNRPSLRYDAISERAYFISLEEGGGDEFANWLRAERELGTTSDDAHLLERVEKLRDSLAQIRDRDPFAEAHGDAATGTHLSYEEHIRQLALNALQHDDTLAAAKPAGG